MRGLAAAFVLSLATCAANAAGPKYDGPVGDPGFPVPGWMLQKFCASGDGIDFCEAYTIDEQRRMMILYQGSLGRKVAAVCDTVHLDEKAVAEPAKEWWPDVPNPPYGMAFDYELIGTAYGAARQRYEEMRAEHPGDRFCSAVFEEPELKGVLGRCVKEADSIYLCSDATAARPETRTDPPPAPQQP